MEREDGKGGACIEIMKSWYQKQNLQLALSSCCSFIFTEMYMQWYGGLQSVCLSIYQYDIYQHSAKMAIPAVHIKMQSLQHASLEKA